MFKLSKIRFSSYSKIDNFKIVSNSATMPSAANVKIDKQINPENALAESSQNLTSLRQAITIIEHKIRNLEKRKVSIYFNNLIFFTMVYEQVSYHFLCETFRVFAFLIGSFISF